MPYIGPGDIQPASSWWGFRAYSAATIGSNICRILRNSDSAVLDIVSLPSGALDIQTAQIFLGTEVGSIATIYDQVAGTNSFTQATQSLQPMYFRGGGWSTASNGPSFTSALFANNTTMASSGIAIAAYPITLGIVCLSFNNDASSYNSPSLAYSGGQPLLALQQGSGFQARFQMSAGTPVVTYNGQFGSAWPNAFFGVMNGTGTAVDSMLANNGPIASSLSAGNTAPSGHYTLNGNGSAAPQNCCWLFEAGAWNTALNATQMGNLIANQRSFYVF